MTYPVKVAAVFLAAYLLAFFEAHWQMPGRLFGYQTDLLPALMVAAGLLLSSASMAATAIVSGLWFDSLSFNPLGVSIFPLFLVGFAVLWVRGLVLNRDIFAQFFLGVLAGAAAPALTLVLLLTGGLSPLAGWQMIPGWIVVALLNGLATPALVWMIDQCEQWFGHPIRETRQLLLPNREIVRGRDISKTRS